MDTREEAQARLTAILRRLEPGMSLRVDARGLRIAFGLLSTADHAARFARLRGCVFKRVPGDKGEFARAYNSPLPLRH